MSITFNPNPLPMSSLLGPGQLIGLIGDEDSCVGFLLAGIGEHNPAKSPSHNFVVAPNSMDPEAIGAAFESFLKRDDIAIILIQQPLADQIRPQLEAHKKPHPAILEIPSKEVPYDPKKDSVLKRAKGLISHQD